MAKRLLDDCFRPGQQLLRHQDAIDLLRGRIVAVTASETVPLADARGRILATPAIARFPVPAHTNSAVDGYAFAHAAFGIHGSQHWPVVGRAAAGHPFTGFLSPKNAVRIFTGAVLPDGTDTVIMQEDTEILGGDPSHVLMHGPPRRGANVRKAGEDVQAGQTLLPAGAIIRPQDLAALASIGLGEVDCRKRLRVAIVSTGDEVVPAGRRPLAPGEVYDANTPMLRALAQSAGADVTDLGIWPDQASVVRDGLAWAAGECDVILTSGGASGGDEDHVAASIEALGARHFWRIQVKPGRPMMFGQIGDTVIIGLPGNPVAVFVCVLMYVWPMLRSLAGAPWPEPRRLMLPAAFTFPDRKTGRREYWRGMLRDGPADNPCGLTVDKYTRDGSGLISSLRESDCLIEIPEDVTGVAVGDPVAVIPFTEFGIVW